MRPFDDIDRLARTEALDRVAAPARDLVNRVLTDRRIADVLHGVPIGHPLHPILAQAAFGSFLSAGVLDLVPRTRRPATALIGVGLVAAVPTAAAGWADYSQAREEQRRVGIVHAAAPRTGTSRPTGEPIRTPLTEGRLPSDRRARGALRSNGPW